MKYLHIWLVALFWSVIWCLYYATGEGFSPAEIAGTTLYILYAAAFCAFFPQLVRRAGLRPQLWKYDYLPYLFLPVIGMTVDRLNYDYDYVMFRYSILSICFWLSWSALWVLADFLFGRRRYIRAFCRAAAFLPALAALFFNFEVTLQFLHRQLDTPSMLLPVLRYLSIPLLKLLLADIAAFFAFYYLEPGRRTGEPAPGSGKRLKIALALLFCFTAYFFAAGPAWKALFENQWEDVIRDRYTEKRHVLPPELLTGEVEVRDNAPNVFFLIIGERQSAAPYLELAEERPLFLSEILKSNDWISCSDAHTFCPTDGEWFYRSQVTTDYAVSMMLTPLSQQSEVRRFYDVPNLFDFARAGGYSSFFCSSQLQWRGFLVNIRLLGDCADETEWLKSDDAARQMHMSMDRDVVARLRERRENGLLSGRQLVVLKLMGNHEGNITPPPELAAANPGMDEYSLSLLYFDETLRQLVGEMKQCPDLAAILYLPDHGKNYVTEEKIPFLIHLSDRFRRAHPELERKLRKELSKPFMSADVFRIMLELLGVSNPDMQI
ncbi:hypothetical protein FYJ85_03850 [Victivallaceae bacterium BBE-744-WT-12]|uniref:Sulfatase N-terminal domain-containing protein n=1 Tax=Victivallis lenta TaxID=2606640 RepID=A0A844G0R4_9BACT|nr:hypothetical protein [Victivallis lenta]AVM45306.1 hypothetical protein C5Q97_11595 [Victivallales bacterium CCUG 44730]MST96178.1 hypothetical protein [Victivallis lenta]HBP07706.1 hypothetical protein [Lentisphaeria bacterium]HCH85994.1 hypothetical protein [Lentisphaeria bacterium]